MPVVSTYQITRSATPFKTRGRPPFTPTGLSAGNKGLATSKNSSGIKPVAIAHLLVHGFMRQVCTRKSHAKFGLCQRFLEGSLLPPHHGKPCLRPTLGEDKVIEVASDRIFRCRTYQWLAMRTVFSLSAPCTLPLHYSFLPADAQVKVGT